MATLDEIRRHLGSLSTILWNYGATFPVPAVDRYDSGEVGFSFTATLAGGFLPRPAAIGLAEIWAPDGRAGFRRAEYDYDFLEHPLHRRRAFHGHDPEHFRHEFHVLVHEHCEERLGRPTCDHYFGLPVDAYEAIRRFLTVWGQPGPLGCAALRCMD